MTVALEYEEFDNVKRETGEYCLKTGKWTQITMKIVKLIKKRSGSGKIVSF